MQAHSPSRDTALGWFILSLIFLTTCFVLLHEGNACHRLGRTVCFTRGSILSRSNAEDGCRRDQCSVLATPPSFRLLQQHVRGDSLCASGVPGPPWLESLKDETKNELIFLPQFKICNKKSRLLCVLNCATL